MSEFCTDVGWVSLNKSGEQLCGDHVEILNPDPDNTIVVLADGLGSGVKASILSTLTAKLLSTMIAGGLPVEDCVSAMASTLPVCKERQIAYSTFSIVHITGNAEAELIQYDAPAIVILRDGKHIDYPRRTTEIEGKAVHFAQLRLQEGDTLVLFSDGVEYAGPDQTLNYGWKYDDIVTFLEGNFDPGLTAKTLSTILTSACDDLYAHKPSDDTTACTVKIRRRKQVNLLIGPPEHYDDNYKMMALFFSKAGKHIVCGGTTAKIAASYLGKKIVAVPESASDPDVPPISKIEGVDLTTEGLVTISRVLKYAHNYLEDNSEYTTWAYQDDGASQIARLLFDEATDIHFFVGKAVNAANSEHRLGSNYCVRLRIIEELRDCLEKAGKRVTVNAF